MARCVVSLNDPRCRLSRPEPFEDDKNRSMIGRNRGVHDPRLDGAPLFSWPNQDVVDASRYASVGIDGARIAKHVRPPLREQLHDLGVWARVHVAS